jgi:hypothetical protein
VSRPDDSFLDPHQLATVQQHADRLLKEAGAYGVFPTPIKDILAAAKLTVVEDEFLDDGMLRRFAAKAKAGLATIKSALSKVLGLFEAHDRLVVIDKDVPKIRKPFVKLHEAGHGTLPHQSTIYQLIHDCENTLDPDITDLFEREANVFASETLFQGERFAEEAHSRAFNIKVPMKLATKFGGSNYSTFRRYVVTNPHACCVVVLEPVVLDAQGGFRAQVRRVIVSKTFHTMYDGPKLFPLITAAHPIALAVPIGRKMTYPREVVLVDRNNDQRRCMVEAFDTTHNIFVLIRDHGPVSRHVFMPPYSHAAAQ